jgi:hypothetical protein
MGLKNHLHSSSGVREVVRHTSAVPCTILKTNSSDFHDFKRTAGKLEKFSNWSVALVVSYYPFWTDS